MHTRDEQPHIRRQRFVRKGNAVQHAGDLGRAPKLLRGADPLSLLPCQRFEESRDSAVTQRPGVVNQQFLDFSIRIRHRFASQKQGP